VSASAPLTALWLSCSAFVNTWAPAPPWTAPCAADGGPAASTLAHRCARSAIATCGDDAASPTSCSTRDAIVDGEALAASKPSRSRNASCGFEGAAAVDTGAPSAVRPPDELDGSVGAEGV
jgi:hypothetical protein